MQTLILHRLAWSIMPQPTSVGMLFTTAMLFGMPPACRNTLRRAVMATFSHARDSSNSDAAHAQYLVMHQVNCSVLSR